MDGLVGPAAAAMHRQFYDSADPRLDGWFMMSSPWPSALLCLAYVYTVKHLGPRLMERRQPLDVRRSMVVYNLAMVVLSAYTALEFLLAGWATGYSFACQPVDYSRSPRAMRMVTACYVFYLSKFIELVDTVFFVVRKKYSHVSFLHVFHHGVMPVSWWFGVKFVAGGFGTFHGMLNSVIHFFMYLYYGLSALGPQYQKYLWWKSYLTKMQIVQFIVVTVHSMQLLFIPCDYPMLFVYWIMLYALIFLGMFAKFYVRSYGGSRSRIEAHSRGSGKHE